MKLVRVEELLAHDTHQAVCRVSVSLCERVLRGEQARIVELAERVEIVTSALLQG